MQKVRKEILDIKYINLLLNPHLFISELQTMTKQNN